MRQLLLRRLPQPALAFTASALLSLLVHAQENDNPPMRLTTTSGDIQIESLATLEYPWGLALLPDDRLLITEKPGRLRVWDGETLSEPIEGVPEVVYRNAPSEQGGLLDVALDPDFENNNRIYLSYVEASDVQPTAMADTGDVRFGGNLDLTDNIVRGGAVARAELSEDNRLTNLEVIWRQVPKTLGRGHFGHRLLFDQDGYLLITSGDRMRFEPAQNLNSNLGKVVRINPDGSIPEDNPFVDQEDARDDVLSYGHRNILAFTQDPKSDRVWAFEMGPLGGDEVNIIEAGKNYGWPLVSNGSHYNGQTIESHPANDAFEAPVRTWTPVISPSGALFYDGDAFKQWQGDIIVGGLSSQSLVRMATDENTLAVEERLDLQRRIRDLEQMPDGTLMLIVDDPQGDLLRLTPAND